MLCDDGWMWRHHSIKDVLTWRLNRFFLGSQVLFAHNIVRDPHGAVQSELHGPGVARACHPGIFPVPGDSGTEMGA